MANNYFAIIAIHLLISSVSCDMTHSSQNPTNFYPDSVTGKGLSETEISTRFTENPPEILKKPEVNETEMDSSEVQQYWMTHSQDSSLYSEIPLSDRIKFGKEVDITEFFRKFVVNSTMPKLVRRKHGRARGRVTSSFGVVPNPICRPINTTVPVPVFIRPIFKILPKCVMVKRCGGCCNDETHVCEAIKWENVTREVRRLKYIGNSSFIEVDKRNFTFKEDNECACNCRVKKEDCKYPQQIYVPNQCSCLCKNIKEHESCIESPNRIWNDEECRCKCREKVKECSSGHNFDSLETCECKPVPTAIDDNEIPDEDRFKIKIFDDEYIIL